ncbi:hypothetical protein ACFUNF_08170 [Streptomyces sp. NPDC057291]|uniref:hypothetical protein n=1 Tax=Streptomyces sp. NPDC057291 TaxID=3346087 RepID=UPI00363F64FB
MAAASIPAWAVCSVIVQLSARGLSPALSQRGGLTLLLVRRVESLALLLATTAVVGVGHGLAFSGGMQQITAAVSAEAPEVRGAVLAMFYTIFYAGLGLPDIGAGLLVRYQGTGPAMNEFALGAAVVCVLILAVHPWVGRRPERAV